MFTQKSPLFDSMLQGVRKATETNLKLQQSMLQSWTRLWPGFTDRQQGEETGLNGVRNRLTNGFLESAKAQRDLVGQQYDLAISAFDEMLSGSEVGEGTDVATPEPPQASSAPPQEVKATPVASVTAAAESVPAAAASAPDESVLPAVPTGTFRNIMNKVAVVTGAASGIGEAVSRELANRGAKAVLLVDRSEAVQELAISMNKISGRQVAEAMVGDTTDEAFRKRVFNEATEKYGLVTIVVPAAGITRDALSVTIDKETGKASIYPVDTFRQVTEVNLLAPIYWGIEMVARIAEDRRARGLKRWDPEELIQGVVVFLGSVSSQGNKGQISYAVAKAGLEGAAATLTKEAIFHGIRCGIIHPGFTDTPMARALGDDFLQKNVLPYTQLRRLIRPEEIAEAICFMISNSAVSGELWCDAGWHGPA